MRNRLAQPERNSAYDAGRIIVLGLKILLDLVQWLHGIEAGRGPRESLLPAQREALQGKRDVAIADAASARAEL